MRWFWCAKSNDTVDLLFFFDRRRCRLQSTPRRRSVPLPIRFAWFVSRFVFDRSIVDQVSLFLAVRSTSSHRRQASHRVAPTLAADVDSRRSARFSLCFFRSSFVCSLGRQPLVNDRRSNCLVMVYCVRLCLFFSNVRSTHRRHQRRGHCRHGGVGRRRSRRRRRAADLHARRGRLRRRCRYIATKHCRRELTRFVRQPTS